MTEIQLTSTAVCSQNRLDALRMYLKQSDTEFQRTLDKAMSEALETLYKKNVPAQVQSFLSLMNGETAQGGKKAKSKKPQKTEKAEDASAAETAFENHEPENN